MKHLSISRLAALACLALFSLTAQAQSGLKALVGASGIGLNAEPGAYASEAASSSQEQRQGDRQAHNNKKKPKARSHVSQGSTREQQGPRNEAVERAQRSAAGKSVNDARGDSLDAGGATQGNTSPGAGAGSNTGGAGRTGTPKGSQDPGTTGTSRQGDGRP